MPEYTKLRGVPDFSRPTLLPQIEANLVAFFQWGLMESGAYTNVPVITPGTADLYSQSTLTAVQQDGVVSGVLWQSVHPNWCYEHGLENFPDPTIATGVYVNGTFYPSSSTVGAYAHHLDFRYGRVVFAAPIPLTSVVQVSYSYRTVGIYTSDVSWFQEVVLDGFLAEQAVPNGYLAVLDNNRLVTPLMIAEGSAARKLKGYELGSRVQWVEQDVLFHIIASNKGDRDRLVDVVSLQKDQAIAMFDIQGRRAANNFALDINGSPVAGASMYPALLLSYPLQTAYFSEMRGTDVSTKLPLYRAVVTATLKTFA